MLPWQRYSPSYHPSCWHWYPVTAILWVGFSSGLWYMQYWNHSLNVLWSVFTHQEAGEKRSILTAFLCSRFVKVCAACVVSHLTAPFTFALAFYSLKCSFVAPSDQWLSHAPAMLAVFRLHNSLLHSCVLSCSYQLLLPCLCSIFCLPVPLVVFSTLHYLLSTTPGNSTHLTWATQSRLISPLKYLWEVFESLETKWLFAHPRKRHRLNCTVLYCTWSLL